MLPLANLFRKPAIVLLLCGVCSSVVVSSQPAYAASPDDNKTARVVGKLLGAAGAQGLSLYAAQKEGLLSDIATVLAKKARDHLVESALEDLMPDAPRGVHRGIRRVACLYLDGELSVSSYTAETAKEEFIEAMKHENVNYGYLAEGADFLYELHKASRPR